MPDRLELERMLKELKEQAEQLEWLARIPEENPNPILRISAGHVLLYSNPAAEELCRYWSCWKGQKVPPVVQEIVSEALAAGAVQHHEIACGPATHWLTVTPCPKEGYVNVYSRDITERRQTEDRLAYLASFPQRNPNPIMEVDLDGDIRFVNPAAMRLFPDIGEQGTSHPWLADWAAVAAPFRQGQTETGLRDVTVSGRTYQQALYYSAENGFLRVYGFDITERSRAEQALREANEQLQMQAEELRAANEELQAQQEELHSQTEELREAEQALRQANEELEQRVAARTADLSKANEAVRAEHERFNDVLETLPAYLVLLTPDHHVPFANRFFRERFGESHGKRCFEYLFGRTEPCEVCDTYKVLKTNKPHRWEWTGPDGRNYDIYDFPFTDTDGSPLIMEMGIDITEQKQAQEAIKKLNETLEQRIAERTTALQEANERLQAQSAELTTANEELQAANEELREQEQALRESEERFRVATESVTDILWQWDMATGELNWHGRIDALLGYGPGQFPRTIEAWESVIHPEDRDGVLAALDKHLKEGRPYRQEYRVLRNDGTVSFWLDSGAVQRDAAGEPRRMIGSISDITERKLAEQRLHAENREIALANRILRVFVEETGDDLFDKGLQIVLEGTGSKHGVFGYIDENGDLVCPSMSRLLDECEVANKCIRYSRDKWKGLWSRALLEKETLYTNKPPAVPRGHVPIDNNLAAPILFQGRAIGLLNLANKKTDYTDADCELIEAIANRIAPVLYAWIQKELRENERKAAEQVLRDSEDRLKRAQEIAHLGSWELNLVNNRLTWSDEVYRIFGLTSEEFEPTYKAFLERVHPEDRAAVDAAYASSLRENRDSYEIEHRVVRNDTGEVRVVHEKCEHFRDAAGKLVRSVGMVHDITERKRMETELHRLNEQLEHKVSERTERLMTTVDRLQDEAARRALAEGKLRKSSQMLEGFFRHTITPLAFLDPQFKFIQVNEAYARADGKSPDYFIGKSHFDLYPHEENRAIFEQVVRTKQPYRAYARPFAYPDDPQRTTYWNWQLTPLLSEFGSVQSLVLNLEDVTKQQRAYQELEHRTRQLQHLAMELSQAEDRERKRLAEILHDDLQQTLAAAKFHMGVLSSRIKSDKSLREITEQVNQMLKEAIDKSRSLSHELSPAVLYQGDLGETCEWLAQQVQTKHGLKVHVETCGHVDARSEALKAFLYRTAQEMLFNVIKHAKSPEARLRLQRVRDEVWLTISDQGRGFDPRALGRTAGFGLLSIRERVGLLGGRMKIRSAVGRGSTFLIAIPDTESAQPPDMPDAANEQQARAGATTDVRTKQKAAQRLRVLLVDDHQVMREGLATLLNEQDDIEVVGQAANGREAVNLAFELTPDVIVMDSSMPVMGGDEATRRIKRHAPDVRVIALSMFEEPQMSRRMRAAGAEVYLLKTAPSEELLAAIRGTREGQ